MRDRVLRVTGLLVVVVSFSAPFAAHDDDTLTPILMDGFRHN